MADPVSESSAMPVTAAAAAAAAPVAAGPAAVPNSNAVATDSDAGSSGSSRSSTAAAAAAAPAPAPAATKTTTTAATTAESGSGGSTMVAVLENAEQQQQIKQQQFKQQSEGGDATSTLASTRAAWDRFFEQKDLYFFPDPHDPAHQHVDANLEAIERLTTGVHGTLNLAMKGVQRCFHDKTHWPVGGRRRECLLRLRAFYQDVASVLAKEDAMKAQIRQQLADEQRARDTRRRLNRAGDGANARKRARLGERAGRAADNGPAGTGSAPRTTKTASQRTPRGAGFNYKALAQAIVEATAQAQRQGATELQRQRTLVAQENMHRATAIKELVAAKEVAGTPLTADESARIDALLAKLLSTVPQQAQVPDDAPSRSEGSAGGGL